MVDFIIEFDSTILEVIFKLVETTGSTDNNVSELLFFEVLKILGCGVI